MPLLLFFFVVACVCSLRYCLPVDGSKSNPTFSTLVRFLWRTCVIRKCARPRTVCDCDLGAAIKFVNIAAKSLQRSKCEANGAKVVK